MLKALNVLKEPLRERGLTHPRLTVYPSNIPSVKTIERIIAKETTVEINPNSFRTSVTELLIFTKSSSIFIKSLLIEFKFLHLKKTNLFS